MLVVEHYPGTSSHMPAPCRVCAVVMLAMMSALLTAGLEVVEGEEEVLHDGGDLLEDDAGYLKSL